MTETRVLTGLLAALWEAHRSASLEEFLQHLWRYLRRPAGARSMLLLLRETTAGWRESPTDSHSWKAFSASGDEPPQQVAMDEPAGLAAAVIRQGRFVSGEELAQDPFATEEELRLIGRGPYAAVPVGHPKSRAGALLVGLREALVGGCVSRFSLMAPGALVGISGRLECLGGLLEREHTEKDLLHRAGLELSRRLRLSEILPLLADLIGEIIPFDAVGIYLYHSGSGELEWFFGRGYPEGAEERVRLKVGQGAVGWVAKQARSLIIADTSQDERYIAARQSTRSELTVPLLAGEELVGVFNLESDRPGAFGEADLRLLEAFGNQAAVAIQRAWLHDQALEKRRLEEEIGIARRIQRRLLPDGCPQLPGFDIAGFNYPSLEVSGDLYDFIRITDDHLGIVIGDVAGKGVPAGLVMATFRASLIAEIRNNYAISVILSKVNALLCESIEETSFVTAVYGVLDATTRRFTYSNAGHNPPLLLRANGTAEWLEIGGTILGRFESSGYREAWVGLAPGDVLVFYTDGITEAESPEGEMFGSERLLEVVREGMREQRDAHGLCARILEAVRSHSKSVHAQDDLTGVVLKVLG